MDNKKLYMSVLSKERLTIDEIVEHCKRMTKKFEKYNKMDSLENNDIDTGMMKEYWEHRQVAEYLEELKQYRDLEEQGLLLRLPVRIGQMLYTNSRKQGWYFRLKDAPYRVQVEYIGINNSEEMVGGFFNVSYEKNDYMVRFNFSDIGKTVFLTQSEAEEKLRELEGK